MTLIKKQWRFYLLIELALCRKTPHLDINGALQNMQDNTYSFLVCHLPVFQNCYPEWGCVSVLERKGDDNKEQVQETLHILDLGTACFVSRTHYVMLQSLFLAVDNFISFYSFVSFLPCSERPTFTISLAFT